MPVSVLGFNRWRSRTKRRMNKSRRVSPGVIYDTRGGGGLGWWLKRRIFVLADLTLFSSRKVVSLRDLGSSPTRSIR
jgi:hypothetical protein